MDSTFLAVVSLVLLAVFMAVRLLSNKTIKTSELTAKIKDGALVLDVRTPPEFGDGHFRTAINIPIDELAKRLDELGSDKSRCIIVYCASGARSAKASTLLRQAGFSDILNAGGLFNLPRE